MPHEELKKLLKEALVELAAEGHHTCVTFKTPEEQQMARDMVRVGTITKCGFMVALAMFILGGAAIAIVGKLTGFLK